MREAIAIPHILSANYSDYSGQERSFHCLTLWGVNGNFTGSDWLRRFENYMDHAKKKNNSSRIARAGEN